MEPNFTQRLACQQTFVADTFLAVHEVYLLMNVCSKKKNLSNTHSLTVSYIMILLRHITQAILRPKGPHLTVRAWAIYGEWGFMGINFYP